MFCRSDLTDLLTTKAQMGNGFAARKLQAAGSTVGYIDKTALSVAMATDKNWKGIFEGCAPGKGQLSLVISQPDGKVMAESKGAWVELKPISSMMQTSWGGVYQAPPDETPEVLTFVHGWNMSPAGSQNFAETMYKRLWHRGYKGRFAAMRWDTKYSEIFDHAPGVGTAIDVYLADFNGSEHIAWTEAGSQLKSFMDGLPSSYRKNVVAHSMGNIVAGAAFLKGMSVSGYAILNGALASSCYDESQTLKQDQIRPPLEYKMPGIDSLYPDFWITDASPDDDPDFLARALAYRGRLNGAIANNWVNFYLPNDEATTYAWESNQNLTKPPANYLQKRDENGYVYVYDRARSAGRHIYKIPDPNFTDEGSIINVDDPFIAMPFACRPWGKAVGAEGKTNGKIRSKVNLDESTFLFDKEHSAQFEFTNQATNRFYQRLLLELNLTRYAK